MVINERDCRELERICYEQMNHYNYILSKSRDSPKNLGEGIALDNNNFFSSIKYYLKVIKKLFLYSK